MNNDCREWFDRVVSVFDAVLERVERRYTAVFEVLDELLAKPTPGPEDIGRLTSQIPSVPIAHDYFLQRLEHPSWLPRLAETRIFSHVPDLEFDEEEGTVGFPRWPAGAYLLRVAKTNDPVLQHVVLSVLKALPETENTSAYADAAEIGTALPGDLASELLPLVEYGLRRRYQMILPHRAANLVAHLVREGCMEEAVRLARVLFEVPPDPVPPGSSHELLPPPSPRPRIGQLYGHELGRVAPVLEAQDARKAMTLWADLLDQALRASHPRELAGRAHSELWWPIMSGQPGRKPRGPQEHLLVALRDAAIAAASQDPASLPGLIEELCSHPWLVFRRVALHVLTAPSKAPAREADAAALDFDTFENPELRGEFTLLLRQRFPHVPPSEQRRILDWALGEKDRQSVRASLDRWFTRPATDAEVERAIREDIFDRLRPLSGLLPPAEQRRYDDLLAEFRPSQPPTGSWGEPGVSLGYATLSPVESPKSADELRAMSDDTLAGYLRGANGVHEPFESSMEGLGNSLAEAARLDPERFSHLAGDLTGIDPSLIDSLLGGLEAAARSGNLVNWEDPFMLCKWVVDQPRAIGGPSPHPHGTPGWAWTRRQVLRLVLAGLEGRSATLPVEFRGRVWTIVYELLNDPDPTTSETSDPLSVAMNSVRGEAIRAVFQYALWLRRAEAGATGLAAMREVQKALEAHLDPAIDNSAAIRAVYGEFLPVLFYLDQAWARGLIPRLFPSDDETLRQAAWGCYVQYQQPLVSEMAILEPEYRRAVEALGHHTPDLSKPNTVASRLAEHLMILVWQGTLSLDDPTGMIASFFEKAPPRLRAHALEFIGQALADTKTSAPTKMLERIRRLWLWRLSVAKNQGQVSEFSEESAAFGWWFASDQFDQDWALDQLRESLTLGGKVDTLPQVLEKLAQLAPTHPQKATQCLDAVLKSVRHSWSLDLWSENVRTILHAALHSDNRAAGQRARDLIGRLASLGLHDYRDL